MHVADGQDALEHIGLLLRIGLVHHAHITLARGPRLVGVDTGNDDELVLCFFLNLNKASRVIAHGFLIVGRAGADDHNKLVAFPGEYLFDILIPLLFDLCQLLVQRELFPYLCRSRQFVNKRESHFLYPPMYKYRAVMRGIDLYVMPPAHGYVPMLHYSIETGIRK